MGLFDEAVRDNGGIAYNEEVQEPRDVVPCADAKLHDTVSKVFRVWRTEHMPVLFQKFQCMKRFRIHWLVKGANEVSSGHGSIFFFVEYDVQGQPSYSG